MITGKPWLMVGYDIRIWTVNGVLENRNINNRKYITEFLDFN
jgi:hypothetical protein